MSRGSCFLAALLALSAADLERLDSLQRWHRAGMSWADLGTALIVEEETRADLGEIVGLRRDGYEWGRLRQELLARPADLRDAPGRVPVKQDQNVWDRRGFEEPGAERGRAPGQPATIRPPESIVPPGGTAQPGGFPEPGPAEPR